MARGLKIPVGADLTGRTAMVEKDDENTKILFAALSDCENEHAFQQDLGITNLMIFNISDPRARARILARVIRIFEKFEAVHRYKLRTDTIRWTSPPDSGELILEFLYHDLESDEEKPFARVFRMST